MYRCFTISAVVLVASAVHGTAAAQRTQDPALSASSSVAPRQATPDTLSLSALDSGDSSAVPDTYQSTTRGPSPSSFRTTFSGAQIVDILEANPDLLAQVKEQAADLISQRGTPVSANDFTDQQLFDQLQSSVQLRSALTSFLVARGYSLPAEGALTLQRRDEQTDAEQLCEGPDINVVPESTTARQSTGMFCEPFSARLSSVERPPRNTAERTDRASRTPDVLYRPAPYNLRSLHDLYAQIPEASQPLRRFGSDLFVNRQPLTRLGSSGDAAIPLDVPLGPDYVLGAGDTLNLSIWGSSSQTVSRTLDRDGSILLPESGRLVVGGMTLGEAQRAIAGSLQSQFRDAHISVTVSRLHSVRIYIAGDVQRPGGYDIGALATPISALIAAGGPTAAGSLRVLRHMRGEHLVRTVDLYDFLLHGVHSAATHFESGDTLLIPPAGPQVTISGAVRRPAIYELLPGQTTFAEILTDAGGPLADTALDHVTIDRIGANHQRETINLPITEADPVHALGTFTVQDGDRIRVSSILPYSQRVLYLQGHVARPGRIPFSDGMKLSDVLHSDRDMLPEPAARGEIVRLVSPDLHAEAIEFNVPDVLIGNANITLEPFDTIRIFGRYEVDAPTVTIQGEVLRPGVYPLSSQMTASALVRMAGGFRRDALRSTADLTSYSIEDGNRIRETVTSIPIDAAIDGASLGTDIALKAGDVLSVHQITGWGDIGQAVTIEGQVRFPGSYGFRDGERLSAVLRRAGGLRESAYPEGAKLVREQVRELEEKSRDELIRQIETTGASARLSPSLNAGGDSGQTLQLIKTQQEEVLNQLKTHPPSGRLVVHISADIDSWANTPADIELRRGDVLTIPKRPGFVLVSGQVYNPTALTFTPDKTAAWYLARAGGTNTTANRKEIFVIRANGSVIGRRSSGLFGSDVLSTRLYPGDVVVVPQKILGNTLFWRNLLATAQLASSIAITATVAAL